MKRTLIPLAVILAVLDLAGCKHRDSQHNPTGATPNPSDSPKITMAAVEKHAELEHSERLATEGRLQQTEAARSRWQTAALLLTSVALVSLIVGTVLGSKARHTHEIEKK